MKNAISKPRRRQAPTTAPIIAPTGVVDVSAFGVSVGPALNCDAEVPEDSELGAELGAELGELIMTKSELLLNKALEENVG